MRFLSSNSEENLPDFYLAKIGDHTFVLEECKNFYEGLSRREELLESEGMLFNFGNKSPRSFHMKECYIPLDIIFLEEGKIKKIYPNCQPCNEEECRQFECDSSDMVVELLGGTCEKLGIEEGLIFKHF